MSEKLNVLNSSKRFCLLYEGEDTGNVYDTYQKALDAVDARREKEEKANRVKINVPIISIGGKFDDIWENAAHVITGVHGGHGGYLAKPPLEKYSSDRLYLDHPVVLTLLTKLREAQATVDGIEEDLKPFALSCRDHERRTLGLTTADGIEAWRVKATALAKARGEGKEAKA